MAIGEPNASTSGEPAVLLSRWKRVLGYTVGSLMLGLLCLDVALALLPLFVGPNACVDWAFAATNFVGCGFALYLFLYSLLHSLPRRGDRLREWWAGLVQAALCAVFIVIAYDSLATLAPGNVIPTLARVAPGATEVGRQLLTLFAITGGIWAIASSWIDERRAVEQRPQRPPGS
jgi:hypothetical protein